MLDHRRCSVSLRPAAPIGHRMGHHVARLFITGAILCIIRLVLNVWHDGLVALVCRCCRAVCWSAPRLRNQGGLGSESHLQGRLAANEILVQFLDHDARRSAATSISGLSLENKNDLIEFFPAIAFRDPSNDVERCPPAYRHVVGRASRQQSFKHCGSTSSSIHEANDTAPESS